MGRGEWQKPSERKKSKSLTELVRATGSQRATLARTLTSLVKCIRTSKEECRHIDRKYERDLQARLNHNREISREGANNQTKVQWTCPQQQDSKLVQIKRNVHNLIECEQGDQNLSSFSNEIINAPLPDNFKMLAIPSYEGLTDPKDHLDAFNDYIDMARISSLARSRCFVVTFLKNAKK